MFDWIVGIIERLGYAGVLALTTLEHLFPPIPSELVMPFAGFVAARGDLHLAGIIAVGAAGSLAGSTAWYLVGRRLSEGRLRNFIARYGRWATVSEADVDRAHAWFSRHGYAAVFWGRLIPGVRTYVSLPAGSTRMPFGAYLLFTALGTAAWTGTLAVAGVLLQSRFSAVEGYVDILTWVLLGGLAIAVIRRYIRCWRSDIGSR